MVDDISQKHQNTSNKRIVSDSLGEIGVEEGALWGAVTQRSLENFQIGNEMMPSGIIWAILLLKKAAAKTNNSLELLDNNKASAIINSVDLILQNTNYQKQFPLKVWQTGSGTQTNMNVNEVVSYLCKDKFSEDVHPNDHVNLGQSTNDVFPSAIHITSYMEITTYLLPVLKNLIESLDKIASQYCNILKVGRTHLQDATPMYFSDEVLAWKKMIQVSYNRISNETQSLLNLAIGGTAVGSGINTHCQFGEMVAEQISNYTGAKFISDDNKFYQLSSKDTVLGVHSTLKVLASSLNKIANDIRWLASGPRAGISEIILPANEPGSSIMPGKINPTQSEAMMQVCAQVIGNDTALSIAAAGGNFQLNVYMPMIAHNINRSINLLTDAIKMFTENQIKHLKPNVVNMTTNLKNSLMIVTNLTSKIGYIEASKVAKYALENNLTIKQSALELTQLTSSELDTLLDPKNMV